MAGGEWIVQNKVLPGVYTNIVGEGASPTVIGERGIGALHIELPWLPEHEVMTLYPSDAPQFIADYGAVALPVQEFFKNGKQLYLYRLNKGTAATVTIGKLKCTARYTGTFGNRLTVSVEDVIDETGVFEVVTWLDKAELERQKVADIKGLTDNHWIKFTSVGGDELSIDAGKPLIGGENGTVTNGDYVKYLNAIEGYYFDAMGIMSDETDLKDLLVSFAKRMIQQSGKHLQCVGANLLKADYEAVISVKNGVYLQNGTHITKSLAVAYITGATAGVPFGESLTEHKYIGAVDVDEKFTEPEQIELAKSGQMVFILDTDEGSNEVKIQKDINTLTTFTDKKTYAMSKNQTMRIVYTVANIIKRIGKQFIGKTINNAAGRRLYHGRIFTEMKELEKLEALQDVVPEDFVVKKGDLIDSALVDYAVRPTNTFETFYNTIHVQG